MDEVIDGEIHEDKEYWLGKLNDHLEKLLKKEKKDNILQKHMASHYYTKNMTMKVKVKKMKTRLNETLIKQKGKEKLDFLVDVSLIS